MSTRLGIELVVDPAFTARAYRARNIICGQYASWAAEMHLLRMSVVSYFQCDDAAVDLLQHEAMISASEACTSRGKFQRMRRTTSGADALCPLSRSLACFLSCSRS